MIRNRTRQPESPKYRPERKKGEPKPKRAYTHVYQDGKRRQIKLPGAWDSPESRREFHEIVGLVLDGKPVPLPWRASKAQSARSDGVVLIAELCDRFEDHAKTYYRKNGNPTGEVNNFVCAMRPLRKLFGDRPTDEFTAACLETVREEMIRNGLARKNINDRIRRLRHVFAWGVTKEVVPADVLPGLKAVKGLKKNRTTARETDERRPVPEDGMRAVLPHLAPQLAAMVELQWETGMRSQEVTSMCPADIDRSCDPWLYWPKDHKTKHLTKEQDEMPVILFECEQEILRPFLDRVPRPDPHKPVFNPGDAVAWRRARRRDERQTDPSTNRSRDEARGANPKQKLRDGYDSHSYGRAVSRACKRAGVKWTPHQLRYSCASNTFASGASLHAAQVRLRHKDLRSTMRYAKPNTEKAIAELRDTGGER